MELLEQSNIFIKYKKCGLWSQSTDKIIIHFYAAYVAGFYKLKLSQSPPSHLQDYSICNNARLEFSTIFVPSIDPNEWCLTNSLFPLSHKSAAWTTRPQLLTFKHRHTIIKYEKIAANYPHCNNIFQVTLSILGV